MSSPDSFFGGLIRIRSLGGIRTSSESRASSRYVRKILVGVRLATCSQTELMLNTVVMVSYLHRERKRSREQQFVSVICELSTEKRSPSHRLNYAVPLAHLINSD